MQRNLNTLDHRSRWFRWCSVALAALTITACGPLGDDEADPTATSEVISQPTAADIDSPDGTPTEAMSQPGVSLATPDVGFSTPIISNPVDPVNQEATPAGSVPTGSATPAGNDAPAETPASGGPSTTGPVFTGSDGTSGATPDLGGDAPDTSDLGSTPVAEETSSDPGSTPVVGESGSQLVAATSCEPDSIPPFGGEQANFVTNTEVNFRTGPGSDCDLIGDGPIGQNIPVTLLSGPVVREEGDGLIWVQVQIDEQTGWVVPEALVPAA